jgi:hypothetical protein
MRPNRRCRSGPRSNAPEMATFPATGASFLRAIRSTLRRRRRPVCPRAEDESNRDRDEAVPSGLSKCRRPNPVTGRAIDLGQRPPWQRPLTSRDRNPANCLREGSTPRPAPREQRARRGRPACRSSHHTHRATEEARRSHPSRKRDRRCRTPALAERTLASIAFSTSQRE